MKHQAITLVKFKALGKLLKLPQYATVGVLESLWLFAQHNARDGQLGGFSALDIAAWVEWEGDADQLVDTLVQTRWLDRDGDRLSIHDWADHAPNWLKGIAARSKPSALPSTEPSSGPSAEPAPQPPNLTKPNQTKPKKSSRRARYVFEPQDRELAEWFWSLVLKLQPNRKPPNLDAWANDVRLIREVDGRPPPEIRSLCEWVHRDEFWQTNILSPAKLRAKWDDLQLRKSRGGNRSKIGAGQQYDPNAELVW